MESDLSEFSEESQLLRYAQDLSLLANRHAELQASHDRLEALYRQVLAALESEKSDVARDLRDALIQAEAARLAKQTFLANMSHELRTPLNAILGLSHIAVRRCTDPKLGQMLEQISAAGKRMLQLVSDLLDTANIEAGQMQVDVLDFSPRQLLESLRDEFAAAAAGKNINLQLEFDPALPQRLRGDPVRIGQVLRNLVANAIKFSSNGVVRIQVRVLKEQARQAELIFEVEDQGIGIAEADQKRIFELFEQVDGSHTRRYEGAGLGLAVCRLLVRLMGGELGFNSAPGRGSLFWVALRLPVVVRASAVAADAPDPQALAALLASLRHLLENGDFRARALCESSDELIRGGFGGQRQQLLDAIETFDYERALQVLDEVSARSAGG